MDFSVLSDEYILSKRMAWARTSLKNERARLNAHAWRVEQEPAQAYEELVKKMKPYSIKTTFVRLGEFYQWMIENDKIPPAKNKWKMFLDSHANLFKHAYQSERITINFNEAKMRILTIEDMGCRYASLQLLEGGLRYCELRTYNGESVIGKGSKPRDVYLREELRNFRYKDSYTKLYKRLKAVGLKPHTLRKLCATELSNQIGVSDIDICEIFGWESIETSKKYRQPKRKELLRDLLSKATS
jgi:integrase